MSTSGVNNSLRTYGLSGSGIDVDAMVTKLMTAAKQPYTKMDQQQILLGWKKQAYNDMYTSINDFRNNKVFNFSLKSTLAAKTATSSNSSAVAVSASGDAANVNHTLQVLQLASGAVQTSSAAITTGTSKTSLSAQFGISDSVALTINGKQINVNASQSINDLASAINKSGAGVTASYDATLDRFFLQTNGSGAAAAIDFSGTDTAGMNFLTKNLKLSALNNIGSGGAVSSGTVGFVDNANLASQFSGLAGSFNLQMVVGGVTSNIAINTTTTSLNDVINSINNIKDSNGVQLATASIGEDGKISIKAAAGNNIDISGSDAAAKSFLSNQLKLTVAGDNIDDTGVSSSSAVGFSMSDVLTTSIAGLASGNFNLKISDGTTTRTVAINTAGKSMQTLLNDINALTDANGNQLAKASFEHGKFTLKAGVSGATLDLSGSDADALTFMSQTLKMTSQKGQDAQVRLDGVTMNQTNNKFTVNNVTYTAQGIGTSSIAIQSDTEKIISSVKTFISDYNTMLASINTKTDETYDSNYLPLTDEQKTSMKDADISLWTTKAKTGILRRDSSLTTLSESMRNAFSRKIEGLTGTYTSASSIGISTGVDWTEKGKLYIDETKLRKALQEDPDVVYKIFGTVNDSKNNSSASNGIAVQISGHLKTAADSIVKQAGTSSTFTSDVTSALGKQNKALTTKMTAMSKKLATMENQYYKQFSAMESALAKLNQQTTNLASMLGQS